jgi:outer membrane immunogenic protein
MRQSISYAVALAGLAIGTAQAADMSVKVPVAPVAVFNWTGCYAGINGGWKTARFKDSADTAAFTDPIGNAFPATTLDLGTLNASSGAVGAQGGCRWENQEHWVIGFEGDFDWTDLHGTIRNVQPRLVPGTRGVIAPGDTFENRARSESSVRLVWGRAFDRLFLYVTPGVAFMQELSMNAVFVPTVIGGVAAPGATASGSKTIVGGTIGAGAAYAISDNWEIGAEYRFTAFPTTDFSLGNVPGSCAVGAGCSVTSVIGHKELQTQEVLFKLNYRFGPGVVVAKY